MDRVSRPGTHTSVLLTVVEEVVVAALLAYLRTVDDFLAAGLEVEVEQLEAQLTLGDQEKEAQNDETFPRQSSSHLPGLRFSYATSELPYELHLGPYQYHSHPRIP